MNQSSRLWWNGTPGTSGPARRVTGPSRCSNACSAISAAISAPKPPNRFASWTTSALPVLLDRCEHRRECRAGGACAGRRPRPRRRPRGRASRPPRARRRACSRSRRSRGACPAARRSAHADRHDVVAIGDLRLEEAVGLLVLEEHDRVGVADRRLEQALGIGRGAGRDHLQADGGGEVGLVRLASGTARRARRRRTACGSPSAAPKAPLDR